MGGYLDAAREALARLDGGAIGKDTPGSDPAPEPIPASFEGWVRRQDHTGRWGWEAPGLPEWQRWWAGCDFDDLPEPGDSCPRCGSLEFWWDLWNNAHCCQCEADKLNRSRSLAARAARLRAASGPPRLAPPRIPPRARNPAC